MTSSPIWKPRNQYVRTLFHSVILCMAVLWTISELQPAGARHSGFGYPGSVRLALPLPSRPIGDVPISALRSSVLLSQIKFIDYAQYRDTFSFRRASVNFTNLFTKDKDVDSPLTFLNTAEREHHLSPEWTRASFSKDFDRIFRKFFYRRSYYVHLQFIPLPALWLYSRFVMRNEGVPRLQVSRSCRSHATILWNELLLQPKHLKEQFCLVQLFRFSKNRLQYLQVLRF